MPDGVVAVALCYAIMNDIRMLRWHQDETQNHISMAYLDGFGLMDPNDQFIESNVNEENQSINKHTTQLIIYYSIIFVAVRKRFLPFFI